MFSLKVNGKMYNIDASTETPLMWVLRDQLGFTGVKYGCGIGELGIPTVAPAVANAIASAVGVRLRRLPIDSDPLKKA